VRVLFAASVLILCMARQVAQHLVKAAAVVCRRAASGGPEHISLLGGWVCGVGAAARPAVQQLLLPYLSWQSFCRSTWWQTAAYITARRVVEGFCRRLWWTCLHMLFMHALS